MQNFIFLFVLLANYWVVKFFQFNPILGVIILLVTLLIYLFHDLENFYKKVGTFILVLILLAIQNSVTERISLLDLTDDEKLAKIQRLGEYDFDMLRYGYLLEGRNESIVIRKITQNLFENLDLNLYFFGNFPRQRIGFSEFEKFSFVLIPFLILGLIEFIKAKRFLWITFIFFLPLIFISLIGNKSAIGPISLFPFFVLVIYKGIFFLYKNSGKKRLQFLIILFLAVVTNFYQQIVYENF